MVGGALLTVTESHKDTTGGGSWWMSEVGEVSFVLEQTFMRKNLFKA